jgi:hypothetical protein
LDLVSEPYRWPVDPSGVLHMYRGLVDAVAAAVRAAGCTKLLLYEPSYGDTSMAAADPSILRNTSGLLLSMHNYFVGGPGCGNGYNTDGSQLKACYAWNGAANDPANQPQLLGHLQVKRHCNPCPRTPLPSPSHATHTHRWQRGFQHDVASWTLQCSPPPPDPTPDTLTHTHRRTRMHMHRRSRTSHVHPHASHACALLPLPPFDH